MALIVTVTRLVKSSIWSPTETDKTSVSNTNTSKSDSELSPDYSKDKFSPTTLGSLDDEIKRNASNINDLSKVCKHDLTKLSVSDALLDERKYLLDQKSKHLSSILQEGKNVPISDIDPDNLLKQISDLKLNVDKLYNKSEDMIDRTLKNNKNDE